MLQDKYRGALTKQKDAYQAAGQLKAMLVVVAELKSLESGSDEPLATYPDLKRLQEIYRAQRITVQANGVTTKLSIIQSFQKTAADLAAKLTKEGKIEDAQLALAEAERFEAMSKDPALAVVQPKAAPAAIPKGDKDAKEFTNSLGMKFVPVPGTDVWFCIHETRWRDYAAYAKENPDIAGDWKNQTHDGFVIKEKANDHPVVYVSLEEAQAFCRWLSKEEKKEYRLLTDHEWSLVVGIGKKEDKKASPEEKSRKVEGEYPWGSQWPPPQGAGNFSDQSRKATAAYLKNYDDGFPTTAPVMSFEPNQFGLYDLGGNVGEWVDDKYSPSSSGFVLRGGSWLNFDTGRLSSSDRVPFGRSNRGNHCGFRCVLVSAAAGAEAR